MSNICEHVDTPYERRTCQCGQVFYVCPKCYRYQPYGWLCLDCERARGRRVVACYTQDGPNSGRIDNET